MRILAFLRTREHYPVLLLHQDLTPEDQQSFRDATKGKVFFQKIIFDEDTLPSYVDKSAFLSWIKPKVRISLKSVVPCPAAVQRGT